MADPIPNNHWCIWPTPTKTPTWKAAEAYVKSKYSAADIQDLVAGTSYTDPKTGRTIDLPGTGEYVQKGTDPY